MKRMIGVDLETTHNPRRYAVFLHNMVYDGSSLHRDVTSNQLRNLLRQLKPDVVAVDSLGEFPKIFGIMPTESHLVEVTRAEGGTYRTIQQLASNEGLALITHPDPGLTARLLVVLVLRGHGRVAEWSYSSRSVVYQPLDMISRSKAEIFAEGLEKSISRSERSIEQPIDFLEVLQELEVIQSFSHIGKGKEAEVFLADSRELGVIAIKVFYRFSSSTRRFRVPGMGNSDWRSPAVLARREVSRLNYLLKNHVRVPEVYWRDGPLVIMEGITDDGKVCPSLSQVDLREHGNPVDYFNEIMDILEKIFVDAAMVHGDFSPPNLLLQENQIRVIDVLQAERYTFAPTGVGMISHHAAFDMLRKDIHSMAAHFRQRYRLVIDVQHIYTELISQVAEW